jgi:RHS repeat-associated protein
MRAVVDEAGDVVEAYDYYPFGLQSRSYKEKGDPLTKETFTGKEQDIESNLHYFGARYYDAGAGRWLSVDPLAGTYFVHINNSDPFVSVTVVGGQNGEVTVTFNVEVTLEGLQFLGELVGNVPIIGEAADGLVALSYAFQGNLEDAGISALAMVPVIGALKSLKRLSPNQMNELIKKGKAPRGIVSVHSPKVKGEQLHVHFDNKAALNFDGTWKHGSATLTRKQRTWLAEKGWKLPQK